ncbi:transcriptional regulator, partial [Pseudomonas syringae]
PSAFAAEAPGSVTLSTASLAIGPQEQTNSHWSGAQTSCGTLSEREAETTSAALRAFWIGYCGFTPYPGAILKVGRQRLRNDDGQWHDTNIDAINWSFDITLLRAAPGSASRFSEYRTDLTELVPDDPYRKLLFGSVIYHWSPCH